MSPQTFPKSFRPKGIKYLDSNQFPPSMPKMVYPEGYSKFDEIMRFEIEKHAEVYYVSGFMKQTDEGVHFSCVVTHGPAALSGTVLLVEEELEAIPTVGEMTQLLLTMKWPIAGELKTLKDYFALPYDERSEEIGLWTGMYRGIIKHLSSSSEVEKPRPQSAESAVEDDEDIDLEQLLGLYANEQEPQDEHRGDDPNEVSENDKDELDEDIELDIHLSFLDDVEDEEVEDLDTDELEDEDDEEIDLEELLGLSEEDDEEQDEISDEDSMAFLSMITGEKIENKEQMDQVINGFIKKAQQVGGLKKKTKKLDPLTTIKGSLSFNLTMYMQYETDIRPNSDEGFEKAIVLAIKLITRWPELNQSKEYDIKEALKVIDNDMRTQMNGITQGIAAQQDELLQKNETEVVYQLASSIRQFVQQQKPDSGSLDRYDFVVEVVLQLLWGDTALDSQLIDHLTKSKEFAEATGLIIDTMNS